MQFCCFSYHVSCGKAAKHTAILVYKKDGGILKILRKRLYAQWHVMHTTRNQAAAETATVLSGSTTPGLARIFAWRPTRDRRFLDRICHLRTAEDRYIII